MRDDSAPAPRASLRVVVVPLLALGVGVGVGFATAQAGIVGEPHAPATVAEAGPTEAPEGGATAAPGSAVTSLGTFTVNLRGTGGGRVLRLEVQVEGPSSEAEALTARSAQLRDSIITAVSDYTWAELEGAGGKTRLRDELFARVNGAAAPAVVERIYFTQFVVQ